MAQVPGYRALLTGAASMVPLLRRAGVYTASNLVGRAIPFLLLPVLTRYLSPADYGLITMFLFVVVIAEPIIGLSFPGAVTVSYFDSTIDLPAYVGTGVALILTIAVPAILLLLAVQDPLSEITQVPAPWLLLAIPLVVARSIGGSILALLRVRDMAATYGLIQNVQSATLIGVSVVLVVVAGERWHGRVEGELLAWGVLASLGVLAARRSGWLRFTFTSTYARQLVRFGVPLIPHTIGSIVIVQTDRLLLTNLVGVDETGLYTVGSQLALVIELVAVSFNYAYAPWLFRQLADVNDAVRRRLVQLTYVQFALMAALAVSVAIVMPWVASVVLDPSFARSSEYVAWFALGYFFSAMYYMVTNYLFFARRTGLLAAVTAAVALLNVPLTYGLIQTNGGIGAAQATAISLFLSFALTWMASARAYPMPWLPRRATKTTSPN